MGCEADIFTETISCLAWQPNVIPNLGATQKYPRFSSGNIAELVWTDRTATQNINKYQSVKIILEGATNGLIVQVGTILATISLLLNF